MLDYERFDEKVWPEPNTGCHLWAASVNNDGYGNFAVGGRKGRLLKAHRVSWERANGPIPEGMLICHRCDTPSCVNPAHLFLGTHSDNNRDAVKKRRNRGFAGRLTAEEAAEIRARHASGETRAILAMVYGVSRHTVGAIVLGQTWR